MIFFKFFSSASAKPSKAYKETKRQGPIKGTKIKLQKQTLKKQIYEVTDKEFQITVVTVISIRSIGKTGQQSHAKE